MGNPYFQFKQFTVWHDLCAMKVGIDGVLLGAWADVHGCRQLLDVGTGSGLIALMLAQRAPQARIDAIDIEESAVRQARLNVSASPWNDRYCIWKAPIRPSARPVGGHGPGLGRDGVDAFEFGGPFLGLPRFE